MSLSQCGVRVALISSALLQQSSSSSCQGCRELSLNALVDLRRVKVAVSGRERYRKQQVKKRCAVVR